MRSGLIALAVLLSAGAFGFAEAQQVAQSDRELIRGGAPTQQTPATRGDSPARTTGTARNPGEGQTRASTGSGRQEQTSPRRKRQSSSR